MNDCHEDPFAEQWPLPWYAPSGREALGGGGSVWGWLPRFEPRCTYGDQHTSLTSAVPIAEGGLGGVLGGGDTALEEAPHRVRRRRRKMVGKTRVQKTLAVEEVGSGGVLDDRARGPGWSVPRPHDTGGAGPRGPRTPRVTRGERVRAVGVRRRGVRPGGA